MASAGAVIGVWQGQTAESRLHVSHTPSSLRKRLLFSRHAEVNTEYLCLKRAVCAE